MRTAAVLDEVVERNRQLMNGGLQPEFAGVLGATTRTTRRTIAERLDQVMESCAARKVNGIKPPTAANLRVVPEHEVVNALSRSFKPSNYQFGNHTFKLDWAGMKHILQRHDPKFWDGSVKTRQSFLAAKQSMEETQSAISAVLKQNRETLIRMGMNRRYQINGTYNGQEYILGMHEDLEHSHEVV